MDGPGFGRMVPSAATAKTRRRAANTLAMKKTKAVESAALASTSLG